MTTAASTAWEATPAGVVRVIHLTKVDSTVKVKTNFHSAATKSCRNPFTAFSVSKKAIFENCHLIGILHCTCHNTSHSAATHSRLVSYSVIHDTGLNK